MKKRICCFVWLFLLLETVTTQERVVKLRIVQTSDIHRSYYPHDSILQQDTAGSLARIYALVRRERETYKDNLILLDNGDILRGQPTAYYYNYVGTVLPHLTARILNYMGCDAGNIGNHDMETRCAIFDRWTDDCHAPVLGANIIGTATGRNRFPPYVTLEHDDIEIVVLGMAAPAIPVWLSENLWKGLRFDDMETTACKWMKIIHGEERPSVVVDMLHAGQDALLMDGKHRGNASLDITRDVPGFGIVLMGHDHTREYKKVQNMAGGLVLVMDPTSNSVVVGDIDLTMTLRNGKVVDRQINGMLTETGNYSIGEDFMEHFMSQYAAIQNFVSEKIGHLTETISTHPACFGSPAFIDLIHTLQPNTSGADISLAAPLSYDARVEGGDVYVYDMLNLYKYENILYTMRLSDKEIHDVLEMSYAPWTNRMASPGDHVLLLRGKLRRGAADRASSKNFSFNFDSAADIVYTVDVTRPEGQEMAIHSVTGGTPFGMDKMYTMALSSYRDNGGGELLTKGAGIPQDKLKERIIRPTDKDLHYYLM